MLPFLKRKAFRDENEIRLLIEDTESHAVQFPPAVKGMITYTKEFRNFSVVSKDDQARFYSECYSGPLHADRPGVHRDFRVPDRG